MANGLLAGSATVDLFDLNTNALIVSTKTLTDSGINMSITGEEARGGQGNALLGKYYHDSSFGLTLTDQIWDLNYLALNCGGAIEAGSDVMTIEQVTVGANGKIEVSREPKAFTVTSGIIGWYKLSTQDDTAYKKFTFEEGKKATLDVAENTIVCIKYVVTSDSARKFKVNTDFIPSTVHAVMTIGLFRAGTTKEALTSSSKIGNIIVDIPNFQLEGAQDLGLTSSSIATMALNGTALATFGGDSGCSDSGYYAVITEDIFGADEFGSVSNIVVADSDIDLEASQTQRLEVYAMYSDGTQPKLLDNTKLTFTSATASVATVDNDGIVTAKTAGTTNIEVVVTSHPELSAFAVVTVA